MHLSAVFFALPVSVSALLPSSQMPLTLLGRSLQAQVTDVLSSWVVLHQSNHNSGQDLRGGVGCECVLAPGGPLPSQVTGPVILGKAQRQMLALTLGSHLQSPSRPPGWLCCRCKSFISKFKSFSTAGRHSVTLQTLALINFPLAEQCLSLVQSSSP